MGRSRSPCGRGRCAPRQHGARAGVCFAAGQHGAGGERGDEPDFFQRRHDLGAIGRRIGEALTARGIRRGKTLIAVGRANIELKNLSIPPAPPEDLPEMVRFQAEREFNTLAEDWPLDFLPLPGEVDEAHNVLAAAISPELVGEIETTCQVANLVPQRLILRPCAAATLLSRVRPGKENKLRLLVDLLAEEADLTVLAGDVVVFMRTARLPTEASRTDPLRALVPEIRRTIAAVHNRFHGQKIEELFVCGEGSQQEAIAREVGRDLDLHTELLDPLKSCTLGADLTRLPPEHPSRFAPLVGMLLHEAAPGEGIIDFLNPRRRPEAPSRKREWIMGAAAAAVVVLGGIGWIWHQLGGLDEEIAALQKKSAEMGENARDKTATPVKRALASIDQAAKIQKWLSTDVDWLDELATLSTKAPRAQDLKLTGVTTPHDQMGHTKMHLDAVADASDVPEKLGRVLRDEAHQVIPGNTHQTEDQREKYHWTFSLDMQIDPAKQSAATTQAKGGRKSELGAGAKSGKADEKAAAEKSPEENQKPAPEKPVTDKPAAEKPTAEKPATDKPAEKDKESDKAAPEEKRAAEDSATNSNANTAESPNS